VSNKYQGPEQDNRILDYIRSRGLELPHLMDLYKLWNAATGGHVSFLGTSDAQLWFGHALFTIGVRMYEANQLAWDLQRLFDPHYTKALAMPHIPSAAYSPPAPGPVDVTYEAPPEPSVVTRTPDPEERQLDRYAALSAFFANLVGALDVLSLIIACIYDLEKLEKKHLGSEEIRPPKKVYFSSVVRFLRELDRKVSVPDVSNLIACFTKEGLLDFSTPSGRWTNCDWYEELRDQRNYYVHLGFPTLYVMNGEWFISDDPKSGTPPTSLSKPIPTKCQDLNSEVRRFIGEVLECIWNDFRSKLP
jgi:hypothetical protein